MHGHTWTVRATWAFSQLDNSGMGMNFRELRSSLQTHIHAKYDHTHLNDVAPFNELQPTAENLARAFFDLLKQNVDSGGRGRLEKVEVWEGPEACAAWSE